MTETAGQLLRATRLARGFTLEDVERVTRIRVKHLAALEADNYAALPSPTHARGFLRNYAEHLGLSVDQVLGLYEEATARRSFLPLPSARAKPAARPLEQPRRARVVRPARPAANGQADDRVPAVPAPPRPPPGSYLGRPPQVRRRSRLLSADVLVATFITVILVALLVWGGSQLAAGVAATPTTEASAAAGTGQPAATATATLPPTPTPQPTPAVAYSGVNITVRAEQRAWVSVRVDGVEIFAGLMPPGEAREFVGSNVVEVTTGNGLGTRIIFNGMDQGVLGEFGELVTRLWTEAGPQTPTPTPTPEVTPTEAAPA